MENRWPCWRRRQRRGKRHHHRRPTIFQQARRRPRAVKRSRAAAARAPSRTARMKTIGWIGIALLIAGAAAAHAADIRLPGIDIAMKPAGAREEVATAIKIIIGLTVLSLAPALLLAVTSFTRIIIVLS